MSHARATLLGLGCLALAACASSAGSNAGGAGSPGTGTAGSTGAAGTVGPTCQVDINPVSPASFDDLTAGPTSVMRVEGEITGPVSPMFAWQWSVTLADGTPVAVTSVGKEGSLVEFPLAQVGTFTIAVELMGSMCSGLRTITANHPGGRVQTFRLRVTPPATALVPAQDLERQIVGGTPTGGNVLALDPGIVVGFDVARAGNEALPSYVRLTDVASGAVTELRTQAAGPNTLRVAQGMYTTLVVPDGDVAPMTFPARTPAQIGTGPLLLDDGTLVSGTVADGAGQPIAGATIVLRAGELVSTTGTTDATGAFHVHARAGTFGVTVVSALAAGALELKLAASAGVVVGATAPAAPLTIKVQPGALVTGTVALKATSASSLTTATQATLTALSVLDGGATLSVGGGPAQVLGGDVHFSLHPAADGTLTTGGVPRGLYNLTVFPADDGASDGVTTTTLDLSAGDVGPLGVTLAQKVMLKGKLLPAAVAEGVLLVAADDGGLPIASQASAGADGLFQILVSPERSYTLRALPRPDQDLARSSFPVVAVANSDTTVQDHSMPAALLYAGRVVDPSLQGVGTALVQAFCEAATAGCLDATVPVAETVTRSDGTFQLMLPDPDGMP